MRINIVGNGSAGRRHARLLEERGHTCTVLGPEVASPVQHPECDAVVIATPPESHKLYLAWYHTLCPILCEGPITWNPESGINKHMYAANWCFVPAVRALAQKCRNKAAVIAHLWFDYDLKIWRRDWDYRVSCYYTDGIDLINHHEIMTAQYVFGSIKQVSVMKEHTGKSLGCDALTMQLGHTNGTLTTINSSWHSTQYRRGISVVFEDGTSEEMSWTTPTDDGVVNQSYEAVIDSWLSLIQTGLRTGPTLLDGFRAYEALQGRVV
jgi:predicted dehydrogenase